MAGALRSGTRIALALTLLCPGLVAAGGGHNSTSPAVGTVQLASLLCTMRSDRSPQGYVRDNRTVSKTSPTTRRQRSALCPNGGQQGPWHGHRKLASDRKGAREPARPVRARDSDTLAADAAGQHKDSRDSFRQEAWFVRKGASQKRVTKYQARKQRWAGPQAMQAANQSSPDSASSAPATATEQPRMAPSHPSATGKNEGPVTGSVSLRSGTSAGVVVPCLACDGVETGLCDIPGTTPAPFKMLRRHGVLACPRFTPGSDSAIAAPDAPPRILIKKFHYSDGAMQLDTGFSDDGIEELSVPLPEGERVTAFTLSKDKLVVLSQPRQPEGLSRVTTLNLDGSEGPDTIDGGLNPALWVKGELYRYHDDRLYTFSPADNKVFVYPLSSTGSPGSGASASVIDLSAIRAPGDELLSVLSVGSQASVALRKVALDQQDPDILVYRLNEYGEVVSEKRATAQDWQDSLHQAGARPDLPAAAKGAADDSGPDHIPCDSSVHTDTRSNARKDSVSVTSSPGFSNRARRSQQASEKKWCPPFIPLYAEYGWNPGGIIAYFDCHDVDWICCPGTRRAVAYCTYNNTRCFLEKDEGETNTDISCNGLCDEEFAPTWPVETCIPYVIDKPCNASVAFFKCPVQQWTSCHGGKAGGTCFNPKQNANCSIYIDYTSSNPSFSGTIECSSECTASWRQIALGDIDNDEIQFDPACIAPVQDGTCHIPHFSYEGLLWDVCEHGQGEGTCTNHFFEDPIGCVAKVSTHCTTGASHCGSILCGYHIGDHYRCDAGWNLPGKGEFYDFPYGCMSARPTSPPTSHSASGDHINDIIIPAATGVGGLVLGAAAAGTTAAIIYKRCCKRRGGYQPIGS